MPRQRTKEPRYYISPTHQPYKQNTCIGYRDIRPPVYRENEERERRREGRMEGEAEGGKEGRTEGGRGREGGKLRGKKKMNK